MARARHDLADEINESRFGQFLLSRQGNRLKEYAHERGVFLIGDLPFFVSLDSSDVWANPESGSNSMQISGHGSWPVCPRIISAPKDSSGATRCMTGKPFTARVIAGALTG